MDKKRKALELAGLGFSIRKIAQILKVSHSTVSRWLSESPKELPKNLPEEVEGKLKALLMHVVEEKGRTRTLSISQIYKLLEVDLKMCGINSERSFRRWLEEWIKQEFGSWSALEKKRRPKKEHAKFHIPKGKIERKAGEWEIDATGYTHNEKTYFLLLARERWSGFSLGGMLTEAKESTGAQHYNKAFNSLDVAKLLIKLFSEYGLPTRIITDNELILKAEIIERGLKSLNIPVHRTKPYSPNQKLIERSFRDIKDLLRYYITTHKDFQSALESAIETYNRTEHKFEHFEKPIIPSQLHTLVEYRKLDEDTIRKAFRERFIRVVRDNTIRIETLTYEFIYPFEERYGEIGRKRQAPQVVCYRDIENLTLLEIWDMEEKKLLGTAKLISQAVPTLDPTELKEEKNKAKRIERRKRKLQEELIKINQQEENLLELLKSSPATAPEPEPHQEQEWDPIKLILGG